MSDGKVIGKAFHGTLIGAIIVDDAHHHSIPKIACCWNFLFQLPFVSTYLE